MTLQNQIRAILRGLSLSVRRGFAKTNSEPPSPSQRPKLESRNGYGTRPG